MSNYTDCENYCDNDFENSIKTQLNNETNDETNDKTNDESNYEGNNEENDEIKEDKKVLNDILLMNKIIEKQELEKNKLLKQIEQLKNVNLELTNNSNDKLVLELEKYKNKLNHESELNHNLVLKFSELEKSYTILSHKYDYIKSEYEKMSEELTSSDTKNKVLSLTKQNEILLENNISMSNELCDVRKEIYSLTRKLKFLDIDYKILSDFHNKYKLDTEEKINTLKKKFGLFTLNDDLSESENEESHESEDTNESTDEDIVIQNKISVFVDNKGIKKMIINGKNYKITNQNIDLKNAKELQKEFDNLYKKYVKKN